MCSYSGEQDADGDPISVDYAWSVEGIDQGVNSDTLSSGIFSKDQEVICSVTPYDTREYGLEVSDTISISNAAPTVTSLSISSTPAQTNDILTAIYATDDIDSDPVSILFGLLMEQISQVKGILWMVVFTLTKAKQSVFVLFPMMVLKMVRK